MLSSSRDISSGNLFHQLDVSLRSVSRNVPGSAIAENLHWSGLGFEHLAQVLERRAVRGERLLQLGFGWRSCEVHEGSNTQYGQRNDRAENARNEFHPNETKMSDGGRERASLGVVVWKSSQK